MKLPIPAPEIYAHPFSYIIPVDDGAAPNPYHGVCTLAICKPKIRKTAEVGDWVVGLGAKKSADGKNHYGKVVYAMRVSEKLTFEEYDEKHPYKRPDLQSRDKKCWLGDSHYDFSRRDEITGKPPRQRPGVHVRENYDKDLSGRYVLISDEFIYFGSKPVPLDEQFRSIIKKGQGHKAGANAEYVVPFVQWLKDEFPPRMWNKPLHLPQIWPFKDGPISCSAPVRCTEG